MAVILKLIDIPPMNLTVDSTLYTADSTELTTDMVTIGETTTGYTINVTTIEYVSNVVMEFYNELNNELTTVSGTTNNKGNYMEIIFVMNTIEGDSFQLTVKNTNGDIIWRGKAYRTGQTDIQNYTLTPKTNNNIIKI